MLIAGVSIWICELVTQNEMLTLFDKTLLEFINLSQLQVLQLLVAEFIGIGLVSTIAGNLFLDRLLKTV